MSLENIPTNVPSGSPNPEELKIEKVKSLYKKELLVGNFETAKNLDLSGISAEEQGQIKEEVFIELVSKEKLDYYWKSVIKRISELKEKLDIPDDILVREIRNLCINWLENLAHKNQDGTYVGGKGRDNVLKIAGKEIPEEAGFEFSEEEMREFAESGFIKFLMVQTSRQGYYFNPELLAQKHNITEILKTYGLEEDFLHSEKMQKFLTDSLFVALDKSDVRDSHDRSFYNTNLLLDRVDYFPTELLDEPENQNRIEQWFLKSISGLHIQDGSLKIIKPEEKKDRPDSDFIRPHSLVRELFEVSSKLHISDSIMIRPEVKAILSQYLDDYFDGDAKDNLGINPNDIRRVGFTDQELSPRAEEKFISTLSDPSPNYKNLRALSDLKTNFDLPKEFLESKNTITEAVSLLMRYYASGKYNELLQALDSIEIPQDTLYSEEFTEFKQKIILGYLSTQHINQENLAEFLEKLDFSNCPEFLSSEELKQALSNYIEIQAEELIKRFNEHSYQFSDDYLTVEGDELKYKFNNWDKEIVYSNLFESRKIAKLLKNEQLLEGVFYQVWSKGIQEDERRFHHIVKVQEKIEKFTELYGISQSTVSKLATEALLANLGSKEVNRYAADRIFIPNINELETFRDKFKLTSSQIQGLALKSFVYFMTQLAKDPQHNNWGYENEAEQIFKKFNLNQESVQESARAVYDTFMANGWEERALKVKNKFNLNVDTSHLDAVRERALVEALQKGDLYSIKRIKEQIQITPEFLEREEVKDSALKLLLKILREDRDSDDAVEFAKEFLPKITVSELLAHDEPLQAKMELLKEKFPSIAKKYLGSLDTFIYMYSDLKNRDILEILNKHPFFEQALLGNEQYGAKLLFQYEKLDKLSRNNIETLYSGKQKILAENPNVDVESPEFRVAMQNGLLEYRSNPEIIQALKKKAVNTEIFLNYDHEDYFDLGQETTANLSEMIVTPIKRIEESLDYYRDIVKKVLTEYKDKLTEAKILALNPDEIQSKISEMKLLQESAVSTGDEKRASGIEKGIKNLEGQLEKNKLISLWDKILGNLSSFDLVKKDVFKTYDIIIKLEEELREPKGENETARRKSATATKLKLEKSIDSLKDKLALLEKRVEEFRESLPSLLSGSLGKERSDSLIQEIQEQVSEKLDHYNTDKSTLANLLSDKETVELTGRPMKISLWSRNPDKDLYLGNYTNCCIRIDSEHLGSECAIADYATDLGMQIVAIYDEKKKIPAVVGWCWVGYDNDDNVALVIDNIEGNTEYTSQYKQQFEERLKRYIEEYAKQSGIQRVVQGPHNNDLTIASMDSKYFKLGGYNRASGYYLEGEDEGPWGEHDDDVAEIDDHDNDFDNDDE